MSTPSEAVFVKKYAPYKGCRVLEVGTAFGGNQYVIEGGEHVRLDMQAGERVDIVHNLHEPLDVEPFDVVFLLSVLEHAQYCWKVAENASNLLKKGGLLLVSAPFQWRVHAYPDDYWRFTPSGIATLFPEIEWVEEQLDPPTTNLGRHENGSVLILKAGRKL